MQHWYSLESPQLDRPSIVTIGAFDGVHLGHQALIQRLVTNAHTQNYAAIVLTFFPHPDVVLQSLSERHYLTHPEKRAALLGELGVDVVITHPFNEETRQMRAAAFVDQLLRHLQMRALWATADFAMGYQREGNISFLREQGTHKGFRVETIELLTNDSGARVSSSVIRRALTEGNVTQARHYLGRPYQLEGEVVHGEKRGRQIGFPTANVRVWEMQVLPANGVYACLAHLGDETFFAVTNVGNRPTFNGLSITVEAHLLDFNRDIYAQTLRLDFMERLRGEMKFNGIDNLIAQIQQDVEQGRQLLQTLQI